MTTVNLAEYGATSNPQSDMTPFVKIAGTKNLYKFPTGKGPDGVLLRRITKIEDALACGGLIITNADCSRWFFWVGQDLVDAMAWGQVCQRPKLHAAQPRNLRFIQGTEQTLNIPTPSGNYYYCCYDMVIEANWDKVAAFDQNETYFAAGIVTSAQYGIGSSSFSDTMSNGMIAKSYMATTENMNTTFEGFMNSVRDYAISLVPAKVRGYYADSYQPTMAAFPRRYLKPSLSVTTMWTDTNIDTTLSLDDLRVEESGGRASDWVALNNHAQTGTFEQFKADNPWATFGSYQTLYGVIWAKEGPTLAPGNEPNEVGRHNILRYRDGPGHIAGDKGTWKGFVPYGLVRPDTAVATLPAQTGVVAGFSVGQFRDAHVYERSVNRLQRFASEPASFQSLDAYVIATMGKESRLMGDAPKLNNVLEANAALAGASATRDLRWVAWQNRGTLLDCIEKFNDAWDEAAEDLARADN